MLSYLFILVRRILTKGNSMNISEEGKALIKKFEGCELESYQCSANVWTIGYGHTAGVKEGDKINQDEAEHLLSEDLEEFEKYVNDAVTVDLTQNQFELDTQFFHNYLQIPIFLYTHSIYLRQHL